MNPTNYFAKKAPKFRWGGISSVSDYSAFGVQLENRVFEGQGFRYGFGGKEKMNEIEGNGNAYDFGARLLDVRLGRWLSVDPLAGRQPSQSPYKAFFNNPLYWADPDGKTEYETVVINDLQSGTSIRIYVSKSDKVKSDGEVYFDEMNHLPYQEYYDFAHVTTITINKDGTTTINKTEEILENNGVKFTDYVPLDFVFGTTAKKGSIYDPNDKYIQSGGFYMTSGKGQGTKYYSKNADYVGSVDDLISALGGLQIKGISKINPKVSVGEIAEALKRMANGPEAIKKAADKIRELNKKEEKNILVPNSKGEVPSVCVPNTNGKGCSHEKANTEQAESGDTLGGKQKCFSGLSSEQAQRAIIPKL